MIRVLVSILAGLLACGGSGSALDGAWQSNRERTLGELYQLRSFSEAQWALLSDPKLFGRAIHVYRDGRAITIFEGRCSPVTTLDVTHAGPGHLRFHYYDGFSGRQQTKTITFEGDSLFVPIALFGDRAREVFSRVPLAEVRRRHPCVDALLKDG